MMKASRCDRRPFEAADRVAGALLGLALTLLLALPASAQDPRGATPRNLTVTYTADGVLLEWDAPDGEADQVTGYQVRRRKPEAGERAFITLVQDSAGTGTEYLDTSATAWDTLYQYRVKAWRGTRLSRKSNTAEVISPVNLGDVTDLSKPRFLSGWLEGADDEEIGYHFELTQEKVLGLGLRRQDTDADLFLENADGEVLASSETTGSANEWLTATLSAGTYYVWVVAQEAGSSDFMFRYGVTEPPVVTSQTTTAETVEATEPAQAATTESSEDETNLGDITDLAGAGNLEGTVNWASEAEQIDHYDFVLTEAKLVTLQLTVADDGAALYVVDGDGNVLHDSVDLTSGATDNAISETLAAGSYRLRVQALASGETAYQVSYEVEEPTAPVSTPSDDYAADTSTDGQVAVNGSSAGSIESVGDVDWFAAELVAAQTYRIEQKGAPTGDGTLVDAHLRGIADPQGDLMPFTSDDESGVGHNSRVFFTPTASGTYYVAAATHRNDGGHFTNGATGTYTVYVAEYTSPDDDDFSAFTGTTASVTVDGRAVSAEIETVGDVDWFAVDLVEGRTYDVYAHGRLQMAGTLNYIRMIGVYDASGNAYAETHNLFRGMQSVHFVPTDSGRHFFAVAGEDAYIDAVDQESYDAYHDTLPPERQRLTTIGTYRVAVDLIDDFTQGVGTVGSIEPGGSVEGSVESARDRDWFAVTLAADTTYQIDLEGTPTGKGTLEDPHFWGVYDATGTLLAGTRNGNGGEGANSRVFLTAGSTATYYLAAGARADTTGTYTLSVDDGVSD